MLGDPQISIILTISVKRAAYIYIIAITKGGNSLVNDYEWLFRYLIIFIPYLTSGSICIWRIIAETNLAIMTSYPFYKKNIPVVSYLCTNS